MATDPKFVVNQTEADILLEAGMNPENLIVVYPHDELTFLMVARMGMNERLKLKKFEEKF